MKLWHHRAVPIFTHMKPNRIVPYRITQVKRGANRLVKDSWLEMKMTVQFIISTGLFSCCFRKDGKIHTSAPKIKPPTHVVLENLVTAP